MVLQQRTVPASAMAMADATTSDIQDRLIDVIQRRRPSTANNASGPLSTHGSIQIGANENSLPEARAYWSVGSNAGEISGVLFLTVEGTTPGSVGLSECSCPWLPRHTSVRPVCNEIPIRNGVLNVRSVSSVDVGSLICLRCGVTPGMLR